MMVGKQQGRIIPLADATGVASRLPYSVELWNMGRTAPERILAQAAGVILARAIYDAALSEHLGRKVILRRGAQVIAESD